MEEKIGINLSDHPESEDDDTSNYLIQAYNQDAPDSHHPLSTCLSIVFPCAWLCACFTIAEREEGVVLEWGRLKGKYTTPGVKCSNPCGRTVIKISTKQISADLMNIKVLDSNGNPLLISGVVQYNFVNTVRTALEVLNGKRFVEAQATAVLKQVMSRYPYESADPEKPSLMKGGGIIAEEMISLLQKRVFCSGAKVTALLLNEIAYSPEISGAMLKRQQASALVEARFKIVQASVDVATEAINELKEKGHKFEKSQEGKIVANLLTILCSERDVQPVILMSE